MQKYGIMVVCQKHEKTGKEMLKMEMEKLYTIAEAAEYLRLNKRTLTRLRQENPQKYPFFLVGNKYLIKESALKDLVKRLENGE